jgi:hypothetical protein
MESTIVGLSIKEKEKRENARSRRRSLQEEPADGSGRVAFWGFLLYDPFPS